MMNLMPDLTFTPHWLVSIENRDTALRVTRKTDNLSRESLEETIRRSLEIHFDFLRDGFILDIRPVREPPPEWWTV